MKNNMFKLCLRSYIIAALLLHFVLDAYDIPNHVFKNEDSARIYLVDDTFFAAYDFSDDSYRAYDIRDSGFPELANPKNIFDSLKYRYLQQEPLAIEQSYKEVE